jgi:hypothetical protein
MLVYSEITPSKSYDFLTLLMDPLDLKDTYLEGTEFLLIVLYI